MSGLKMDVHRNKVFTFTTRSMEIDIGTLFLEPQADCLIVGIDEVSEDSLKETRLSRKYESELRSWIEKDCLTFA
jgi:superfamily I DNA and RNA helicase